MAGGVLSPNFAFLAGELRLLAQYGSLAERYVFDDPNTALFKLRQFTEVLVNAAAVRSGLHLYGDESLARRMVLLRDRGVTTPRVNEVLHGLRTAGNRAVHEGHDRRRDALHQLKMARIAGLWWYRSFVDLHFRAGPFIAPSPPKDTTAELLSELAELRKAFESKKSEARAALQQLQVEAKARQTAQDTAEQTANKLLLVQEDYDAALQLLDEAAQPLLTADVRVDYEVPDEAIAEHLDEERRHFELEGKASASNAKEASTLLDGDLDEADTRKLIDAQLRAAGWEVDTVALAHARGTRPAKGRCLAIAEWPTARGPADYVLFVGLVPIAIVEAKRMSKNVQGVLSQARRYAEHFNDAEGVTLLDFPGQYVVPFAFATNGRPYLRQHLTASGIWFHDLRQPTNVPRALEAWYTPTGLMDLFDQDHQQADQDLKAEATEYLPLRYYQHEAVQAVEAAIAGGQRSILLAMATGTGKTRTCIALCYRLIKHKRFRRILFLVDRTSLGDQAGDSFEATKLEQRMSFSDICNLLRIETPFPEDETELHIATVQGMVHRLMGEGDGGESFNVDTYDCVVVDECHRGYNLDREMSEAEETFRSEAEYISKYRRVLDHFDAVKIGLTATPALHTTDIFGDPVYTYGYRKAVIDDYLVDHEPPVPIVTKLNQGGITWKQGEEIEVFKTRTKQVDLFRTPDEVSIEVAGFNTKVLTRKFNVAVAERLAELIDPTAPGKTLIFAATDEHADLLVEVLTDAFKDAAGGELDHDWVEKITGSVDRPRERIQHFKNEKRPSVVVTVDLLTTGIDVPDIDKIVFLRRVKSRILYEQMLGRATRLQPNLYGPNKRKEVFRVYDAVDLYAALEPYSSMKPVVTNPRIPFAQLIQEITTIEDDAARQEFKEQLVTKLQRKKQSLGGTNAQGFQARAGMDPDTLVTNLKAWSPAEAAAWFEEHPTLAAWLDEVQPPEGPVQLMSHHEDEVLEGEVFINGLKPEDYLEEFKAFVADAATQNRLAALKVVLTRPRELTRKDLRDLKLALDTEGYSEANLRTAWRETTNQDIAAGILGYIRQQALGSPLVPYKQRVDHAIEAVLASRKWTVPQRNWLTKIGAQLKAEEVVDREALDEGWFRAQGGYKRVNKIFKGAVDQVLGEVADHLWEDAG